MDKKPSKVFVPPTSGKAALKELVKNTPRLNLNESVKVTGKIKEKVQHGPAPLQQDLVSPVEGFRVMTATERRLDNHYQEVAKQMVAIREAHPFYKRDAEDEAKRTGMADRIGLSDAAYSIYWNHVACADALCVLICMEDQMTPSQVYHAEKIIQKISHTRTPCAYRGHHRMKEALLKGVMVAEELAKPR